MVKVRGYQADIVCNECGLIVRTVPFDRAEAALKELAPEEICSARCTHCGAVNTFPGFSSIQAFVCSECGDGEVVERPIQ